MTTQQLSFEEWKNIHMNVSVGKELVKDLNNLNISALSEIDSALYPLYVEWCTNSGN